MDRAEASQIETKTEIFKHKKYARMRSLAMYAQIWNWLEVK